MTKKEPDPIRIQLTLGVLGFVGVLLTVLATIFGPIIQENLRQRNQPTQTPIVIVESPTTQAQVIPTDTVSVGDPTLTAVPATDVPAPTATAIAPVALGEDWKQGCISTLWKPYPADTPVTEKGDGCWQEPVHVFSAEGGALNFLAERGAGSNEVYGLFAKLPESGSVTIKIKIKDLSNVDLLMGIYTSPDVVASPGLLMTIPAGDPKKRLFVQKDNITDYNNTGAGKSILLDQGVDGYSLTFTFDALSAKGTVNPSVFLTNPISLPSTEKWLFLGYKGLSGAYRVDGTFLSFELK